MNFSYWYHEVADMPELRDGQWVDLETGIPYSAHAAPAPRPPRKPSVLEINGKAAKVADGLAFAVRLAGNQAKAMDRAKTRNAESAGLSAYLMAAEAAVAAAQALTPKSKKAEIADAIRLNQAASRAANAIK